jgi:hypothetical protein
MSMYDAMAYVSRSGAMFEITKISESANDIRARSCPDSNSHCCQMAS